MPAAGRRLRAGCGARRTSLAASSISGASWCSGSCSACLSSHTAWCIWRCGGRLRAANAPMQTARSWLFGDVRPVAVGLTAAAAVLLAAGGIAFLVGAGWWPWLVMIGSAVSVLLIALTFTP